MTIDLKLAAKQVERSSSPRAQSAAFATIVAHTQAPLYRCSARLMGDLAAAEDALQEAYLKAFKALRQGRFDARSSLTTWLYRIVTNSCLDAMRKRRELPQGEALPEPRFDGRVSAEARLALQQLDGWLNELPPQQRAVVVLKTIEGLSTPETAAVLSCSTGAVEQRLVRARASLRARRAQADITTPDTATPDTATSEAS